MRPLDLRMPSRTLSQVSFSHRRRRQIRPEIRHKPLLRFLLPLFSLLLRLPSLFLCGIFLRYPGCIAITFGHQLLFANAHKVCKLDGRIGR
jgi:hypothetical protein